jgi:hypothetical protein
LIHAPALPQGTADDKTRESESAIERDGQKERETEKPKRDVIRDKKEKESC